MALYPMDMLFILVTVVTIIYMFLLLVNLVSVPLVDPNILLTEQMLFPENV